MKSNPLLRWGSRTAQQTMDAQALLQNLDELLGRLREANIDARSLAPERKT